MGINDIYTKYTLAENWILRMDPLHTKRIYSAYDINTHLCINITESCFYLLKIFHDYAISISCLHDILQKRNINIDWKGFWTLCENIRPLTFLVPSEKPLHIKMAHLQSNIISYGIPISSTPLSIEIQFTPNCNLKCKHCFQNSSPKSNSTKILQPSQWVKIFKQIELYNVHTVTLTGGEIMFYPYFSTVFNAIVDLRISYNILTNGILIDKYNIDALSKSNVTLTISLDGHSAEIHDMLRGKGAFDKTIRNIKDLIANNANVVLAYTINSYNFTYLHKAIELALSLNIKEIIFGFTLKEGRTNENQDLLILDSQRKWIRQNFAHIEKQYNQKIAISLIDILSMTREYESKEKTIYCSAGTTRAGISADGKLYPCVYAFGQEELVIGDLTTENLKELWENNDKWRPFRQGFNLDKIASCASCSLKLKCSLAGCRLRNYGLNKSFYNKPQECALDHTFLL